ncbi:MAG: hypothetical protein M3R51_08450 [Candidatus Eremiobacteraeota bacterium]|nr:hypothetical protein [Candidatus Eremiobacteraeota bacterium]
MNVKRVLLVGGALTAGFLLVKKALQKDIERYNALAAMSGDKPLLEDQLDKLKSLVGAGGRNGSR